VRKNIIDNNLLYGLVLAGGRSERMGKDKGRINWHGKEQRYYLADLLRLYCEDVYISCRREQKRSISSTYKTILDTYEGIGQYGALLSAMTKYPDRNWLVVACDMPFVDGDVLTHLISNRDLKMMATAQVNPVDGLPEPLAAIWEAKSRTRLLELLRDGISCPRKALIRSGTKVRLIKPLNSNTTMNVNTVQEAELARQLISGR
jgi:molybdopterin-guanine dinucleotide biosynthesis protein A